MDFMQSHGPLDTHTTSIALQPISSDPIATYIRDGISSSLAKPIAGTDRRRCSPSTFLIVSASRTSPYLPLVYNLRYWRR